MSKFDKIFAAREEDEAKEGKPVNRPQKPSLESKMLKTSTSVSKTAPRPFSTQNETVSEQKRGRGRPPAKRSDPDFVGFTTYVRKDTHRKVKIALLQEGDGTMELSELVEELLSKWVKNK